MIIRTLGSVRIAGVAAVMAGCALAAVAPTSAAGQRGPLATSSQRASDRSAELMQLSRSLARGGYAVVIDLDVNELSFRHGREVLWTAPIGTGTGLRLETEDHEWDFSTPDGVFQVQYKEEDPTWIAPDWYFIENDLPVPARDHPSRRFPGGLGAAAVYIGHDLAIHGTDKPELLGQRVSHGCIRLSDTDAQRLFHNVQIGTEVVIVGGKDLPEVPSANGNDPSTFTPKPAPKPVDAMLERWKRMSTRELGVALADELWVPGETSRWPEVANLLLDRALKKNDETALSAILSSVGDLPNGRVEREYRTFLADAFTRAPLRTLAALSGMGRRNRDVAASGIVAAIAGLYSGDLDSPSAPWPTSRVPRASVRADGQLGWNALARAERGQRESAGRRTI